MTALVTMKTTRQKTITNSFTVSHARMTVVATKLDTPGRKRMTFTTQTNAVVIPLHLLKVVGAGQTRTLSALIVSPNYITTLAD